MTWIKNLLHFDGLRMLKYVIIYTEIMIEGREGILKSSAKPLVLCLDHVKGFVEGKETQRKI